MQRIRNLRFKAMPVLEAIVGIPRALRDYLMVQPMVAALGALSIVLFAVFFLMLGSLSPHSPGSEAPLGQVLDAAHQRQVAAASLLDEDARVEVLTRAGQRVWAAYPDGEGQTSRIIDAMQKGGAVLTVDQQSGKATKKIIVQFLLPILLLVVLF